MASGRIQVGEGVPGVSTERLEFWRSVIEAFSDGVCITSREGVHMAVNDALCQMTGFSRQELEGGLPPFPYWSAQGMDAIRAAFERTFRGDHQDFELLFCRKNGQRFPALVHPSEVAGPDGTTLFYLATVKDISERKRMEQELLRSEQRWRSIAENPFDFVVVVDRDYKYTYVNHTAPGIRPEDMIGKAVVFDFVDPADVATARAAIDKAFQEGVATSYDIFVPQLGQWFGNIVGPIFEDGQVTSISILTRDVTDTKRAEESLRQSERRLQLALAGGDVGAFDLNLATGDFFCSPRLFAMLGYADGDPRLSSRPDELRDRLHPDDAPAILPALERALATDEAFDGEYRLRTSSGEYRWFHGRGRLFREAVGGAAHFSGFVTDVTSRKLEAEQRRQLESKLRHAQKLETLGTLAGGIAHDFNNLLMPIVGNAQVALRGLGPQSPVRAKLEEVLQAAARARELVKRILVFGRRTDERREPVRLPEIVGEVLSLLKASMPASIQVTSRAVGDCPVVMADPNQIHQALTNVCTNAYQALGTRPGRIDVTIESVPWDAASPGQPNATPTGHAVRISIKDDGPGMAPAVLERVFDPFFTTKAVGEGSGLGLSMVHAIVTQHGGGVTAHSQPGWGSLFELWFPVLEQAGEARVAAPATEAAAPVTAGRILCVDDEPSVLSALVSMLECAGHIVTGFASPTEALRVVRAEPNRFDLVMTDLTMPEMRGVELAARLADVRLDLPVVLVTGYGDAALAQGGASSNIRLCLGKPVDIDALIEGVEQLLGSHGQRHQQ